METSSELRVHLQAWGPRGAGRSLLWRRDQRVWAGLALCASGTEGLQGSHEEAGSLASWDHGVALPRTSGALSRIYPPEALGSPWIVGIGGVPERKGFG